MGLGGVKKEWGTTSNTSGPRTAKRRKQHKTISVVSHLRPFVALAASNRPFTEPKTLVQGDGTIVITA